MVIEVAVFTAKDGHAEQFAQAYAQARDLIASSPGCRSVRMTRGVENPERFVLLVEWDTLEAHTVGFRGSERFTQWRGLIGPHFASADVEHVVDLEPERA
jgi:heme-degrading monooxygenase HmoA